MNLLTSDCGFYWIKPPEKQPVEHDERFSISPADTPLMVSAESAESAESQSQNTFEVTRLPERLTVAVSETIAVPQTVAPEPVSVPEVIAVPEAASCAGLFVAGTSPAVKKQIPEQLRDVCQQWLALSHRFPKDLSFEETSKLVEDFREILLKRMGLASEPSKFTTDCQPLRSSSKHCTNPADQNAASQSASGDSSQRDHQLVDHFWLSYLDAICRRITQIRSDDVRENGHTQEEPAQFTFEQLNRKSWELYAKIGMSYPDGIPLILKQASYPLSHGDDTFAIIHSVVFQGVEAISNLLSTLLFSLCEYYQGEQLPLPSGSEPAIIRLFEQLGYWQRQNDKLIVPRVITAKKGEIRPMGIIKSMERIIPKEHPFQQALAKVQLDNGPINIIEGSVARQKTRLKQTIEALASTKAADDLAEAKQRPSPTKTQRKQKKDKKTAALSCNKPAAPSTAKTSEAGNGKKNSGERLSALADSSSSAITFARHCNQLINADNLDLLKKLLTDNPQLICRLKKSQKNKINSFLGAKGLHNFMPELKPG